MSSGQPCCSSREAATAASRIHVDGCPVLGSVLEDFDQSAVFKSLDAGRVSDARVFEVAQLVLAMAWEPPAGHRRDSGRGFAGHRKSSTLSPDGPTAGARPWARGGSASGDRRKDSGNSG
jgi:hypothetical protein